MVQAEHQAPRLEDMEAGLHDPGRIEEVIQHLKETDRIEGPRGKQAWAHGSTHDARPYLRPGEFDGRPARLDAPHLAVSPAPGLLEKEPVSAADFEKGVLANAVRLQPGQIASVSPRQAGGFFAVVETAPAVETAYRIGIGHRVGSYQPACVASDDSIVNAIRQSPRREHLGRERRCVEVRRIQLGGVTQRAADGAPRGAKINAHRTRIPAARPRPRETWVRSGCDRRCAWDAASPRRRYATGRSR